MWGSECYDLFDFFRGDVGICFTARLYVELNRADCFDFDSEVFHNLFWMLPAGRRWVCVEMEICGLLIRSG